MEIRLRPELEELIKQDLQRGAYETVDEFVEQAVSMLHEQEAWLAAIRPDIQTKIAEGYASAQRGELIGPDEVRVQLAQLKRQRSVVSRADGVPDRTPHSLSPLFSSPKSSTHITDFQPARCDNIL